LSNKKMLKLTLLMLLVPGLLGQQCKQPSDCSSPHAPHCSRWGWCQWTADYGEEGPREDLPTTGYCNSNKDCVPRAPFCSRQGYCTQRPAPKGKHSGRQKNKPARDNRRKNQIGGRAQDRAQDRASQDHSMPEGRSEKRPQTRNHRTENRGQQQSHRRSQESRVAQKRPMSTPVKARPEADEEPRARDVLPSGTFLLSQMNTGFGQRRVDIVQPEQRNFQPPPPPPQPEARREPQNFRPSPPQPPPQPEARRESQNFQPPSPRPRTTPAPVFNQRRPGSIDRQSSDYSHTYDYNIDYSNYDYYTDFEVQKTQPESSARGEGRRLAAQEEPLILENPPEGQSQGCLYDCVYDCVSITQLEAYRACVEFCGKTCTTKK